MTLIDLTAREALARSAAVEGQDMLGVLSKLVIKTTGEFGECGEILKGVVAKRKFLEEERTISVSPLNDEVKRINGWFKPASDVLKLVESTIRREMGQFELRQKAERDRLMAAAAAEAQRALAAPLATVALMQAAAGQGSNGAVAAPMAATNALVQAAAAATPAAVAGVSGREVWTWAVADVDALDERFTLKVVNKAALDAWVKEHGNSDVPRGVVVTADVKYVVRG
jgi:hypothetical protein